MKTLLSPESTNSVDRSSTNTVDRSTAPKMTKYYQADQQVKYLHLQAEIEVLLHKVQNLKQQKS
ncbi:MAG: hypothetical protein AB4368_11495 [Xenococcaceae cyanobacterium]